MICYPAFLTVLFILVEQSKGHGLEARPALEAWPENDQLCDLGSLRDLSEIQSLQLYHGDNNIHLQRCCRRRAQLFKDISVPGLEEAPGEW